jgi:hypothetical protein
MVFGVFSSLGTIQLAFTSARMDSVEYIQVLENRLLPYLRCFCCIPLIHQQDNTAIHMSNATKVLDQSAPHRVTGVAHLISGLQSDGKLWAIAVQCVYANNKEYDSVEELKIAISVAWQNLEPNVLQKLVDSMRNRIYDLIMNNLHSTNCSTITIIYHLQSGAGKIGQHWQQYQADSVSLIDWSRWENFPVC